jgi:hypothetical protein
MNQARTVLDRLAELGAVVEVKKGDRLVVQAGSVTIPRAILRAAREHKALILKLVGAPPPTSLLDIASAAPIALGNVGNSLGPFACPGGEQRHIDVDERAAIAEHDGSVPAIYAEPFATLQLACPANVPEQRWQQAINDAGIFLDRWGGQAERFGWPPDELFVLHGEAPMTRYEYMGLIWILRGKSVIAINPDFTTLSNSNKFYRKPTAGKGRGVFP